ncbi:MAG: PH domain-containing protein [Clostridiales bacterium]|jgi:hypothetical protein|nr:PH domain-containing protein [Clostridiales bacterium]
MNKATEGKKRIKIKNRKHINILVISVFLVLFILAIVDLASSKKSTLTDSAVSASITVFLGVVMLFLCFYSFYTFSKKALRISYGFLSFKIPYDDMRLLRRDKDSRDLYLVYVNKDVRCIRILTNDAGADEFITEIRKKNTQVIYELFDKEKEFNDEE